MKKDLAGSRVGPAGVLYEAERLLDGAHDALEDGRRHRARTSPWELTSSGLFNSKP